MRRLLITCALVTLCVIACCRSQGPWSRPSAQQAATRAKLVTPPVGAVMSGDVGLVLPGPVDTPMVHGRLGGPHYPVPPGIPVLTAGRVAAAILDVVERRIPEMVLPRRLASGARLGSAFPSLVDRLYKWLNCGSGTSARRTPR